MLRKRPLLARSIANPIYNVIRAVEGVFKGLAHIFGALVTKDFKFSTGFGLIAKSLSAVTKVALQILISPAAVIWYAFSYSQRPMFEVENTD